VAQHDYVIANGTGAAVRSDLNNALAAIVSNNSGATEPATMYAYQWWADTSTGLLKLRNAANNAWITLRELDGTLTIEAGTVSAPGLAFASDLNTGIYSPSADQLGITTGGTVRLTTTTTGITSALPVDVPLGTASAPTVTFTGDLNTGIYSPGADQVAISTNGTGRLFVDSSGRVLIGTSSARTNFSIGGTGYAPQTQLEGGVLQASIVRAVSPYLGIAASNTAASGTNTGNVSFFGNDGTNFIRTAEISSEVDGTPGTNDMPGRLTFFTTADNASSPTERMRIDSSGRVGIGTAAPGNTLTVASANAVPVNIFSTQATQYLQLTTDSGGTPKAAGIFTTNDALGFFTSGSGTERARIDSSGRLLVGTSTARTNFFNSASLTTANFQLEGTDYGGRFASIISCNSSANEASCLILGHQKSGSVGGNTILASGDAIGRITYQGSDGSEFVEAAYIQAEVDGTPGANDMPGRLVFSTTADGGASPIEAMRIRNTQNVLIGTQSQYSGAHRLEVVGNASGGDQAGLFINATAAADTIGVWNKATSGNNVFLAFVTEASPSSRGTIDYNRAAGQVRYNVTSDRRLKSDIQDSGSALSILNQIKVRSYTWAETGYGVEYGFIAQELNEAAPDAVKVGDDGDEVVDTWAVDNAKLVPLLTKALQEALQKIDAMEARLSALEGV
jgi:hypothetical protein